LTTKIIALVDALGNLVRFVLLPGQRHDTIGVPPLIEPALFIPTGGLPRTFRSSARVSVL
jgi:hypothetical protein